MRTSLNRDELYAVPTESPFVSRSLILRPTVDTLLGDVLSTVVFSLLQTVGGLARSRTALVRMLWDFLGTEFGSRHQQYEKFYGGASFLVKQNVFRNYDFKRATALVDKALALPPVEQ
jgi:aromatic ring hydroxylase